MASKDKAAHRATKRELSANNYVALVAVGSLLIVTACGFAAYKLSQSIVLNGKVVVGKAKAVNDLDTKVENAPKLIEAYNQLGPKRLLIAHSLPNTEDFPQIVSIAESISAASGTKVKTVAPNANAAAVTTAAPAAAGGTTATTATATTQGPATPQEYNFTLTVDGSYIRVIEYLKALEQSSRPMKVTAIEFRGDSGTVSADMQVTTYFQGPADISDKLEAVK